LIILRLLQQKGLKWLQGRSCPLFAVAAYTSRHDVPNRVLTALTYWNNMILRGCVGLSAVSTLSTKSRKNSEPLQFCETVREKNFPFPISRSYYRLVSWIKLPSSGVFAFSLLGRHCRPPVSFLFLERLHKSRIGDFSTGVVFFDGLCAFLRMGLYPRLSPLLCFISVCLVIRSVVANLTETFYSARFGRGADDAGVFVFLLRHNMIIVQRGI
jgi:hypothetical protein